MIGSAPVLQTMVSARLGGRGRLVIRPLSILQTTVFVPMEFER